MNKFKALPRRCHHVLLRKHGFKEMTSDTFSVFPVTVIICTFKTFLLLLVFFVLFLETNNTHLVFSLN